MLANVTTWPTTPMTDCRICTSPSNAAPASSPNIPVIASRSGAIACATPPSWNSPVMKSLTRCKPPRNVSKTASPASPKTFPTMPRISSRWSPRILTTAMMLEITPTMGSAPDSSPPKPEAIGPHILPSAPIPALIKLPTFPSAPPIICPGPELATRPARPIAPCASPPAFPATQPAPLRTRPTPPLTNPVKPVASEMPDRISPMVPPVAFSPPRMPLPIAVLPRFPSDDMMPPKYCPIPLPAKEFFIAPNMPP